MKNFFKGFTFKSRLFIFLGVYGVLVLFDIFAINVKYNNGTASIFLTILFCFWFLTYGIDRIIKENEAEANKDKKDKK